MYILEERGENPLLARNCKGAEKFCGTGTSSGQSANLFMQGAASGHWHMPGRPGALQAPKSGDFNIHLSYTDSDLSGPTRHGRSENKRFFLVQAGYGFI
jgi:hypothetical protein